MNVLGLRFVRPQYQSFAGLLHNIVASPEACCCGIGKLGRWAFRIYPLARAVYLLTDGIFSCREKKMHVDTHSRHALSYVPFISAWSSP